MAMSSFHNRAGNLLRTCAIAALLSAGLTGVGAVVVAGSAAHAQEAERKLDISKNMRKPLGAIQKLLGDQKWAEARDAIAAINEADYSTADDRYIAASFLYQTGIGLSDNALLKKAALGMYESGVAGADQEPKLLQALRDWEFRDENYEAAMKWANMFVERYPNDPNGYISRGQFALSQEDYRSAIGDFQSATQVAERIGAKVDDSVYRSMVSMAQRLNDPALMSSTSLSLAKAFPSAENWRIAAVFFRERAGLRDLEILGSYRLQFAADALEGQADYYEMADLLQRRGMFAECEKVIARARARNVFSGENASILKEFENVITPGLRDDKAALPSQMKQAKASSTGELAALLGENYMGYGDYTQAVELLTSAEAKGVTGKRRQIVSINDVHHLLGVAQIKNGNLAGAKESFAKISGSANFGDLAAYWEALAAQQAAPAAVPAPAPEPAPSAQQ